MWTFVHRLDSFWPLLKVIELIIGRVSALQILKQVRNGHDWGWLKILGPIGIGKPSTSLYRGKVGISPKIREKQHFCRLWHSISQSNLLIWKQRKDQHRALPEISVGHNFCIDQAVLREDSHFLVLSLSFFNFSAAGNGALIWKCVHLSLHKKWSRKATTTRKSGA